jgi:hypothetical protein
MTRTDRRHVHGRATRTETPRSGTTGSDGPGTAGSDGDHAGRQFPATVLGAAIPVCVLGVALVAGSRSAAGLAGVVAATLSVGVSLVAATVATGAGGAAIARGLGGDVDHHRADHRRRSVETPTTLDDDVDPAVLSLVVGPYATVEGTHRRLRSLERLFRERGDSRAVFLTVYARVTGAVGEAIDRGAFDDPDWVADYLVTFANVYRRALLDFETGRTGALPTAWRLAFRAAERDRTLVVQHAALGINAHVAFDLAFALFAVGLDGDRRAKYRDHWRINLVLWRLVEESVDRLAERYAPGLATLADAVGPLVEWCWFGALLAGREVAWWVAVVLTDAQGGDTARAARWLVAAASTAVARLALLPTAHPVAARATRAVTRLLGIRRL